MIRRRGGLPHDFVVTKADPALGASTFTAERVRTSFEESRTGLAVERLALCYLHGPGRYSFEHISPQEVLLRA